ncbi:MAG: D-tyrosyl-tRNA(Tyr) deacylase [Francisellaceae bacterium]|jgi:D-tyrosyl-tRNA(Tyr) deacylase
MIALIQRVKQANVLVNDISIGSIDTGILALIGIEKKDTKVQLDKLLKKILGYRIFPDEKDNMNLNLQQTQGGLLLVPQFTLAADTNRGLRPSFSAAAQPDLAKLLFEQFVEEAESCYGKVESGQFSANMQIELTNDGPVTFWLQT